MKMRFIQIELFVLYESDPVIIVNIYKGSWTINHDAKIIKGKDLREFLNEVMIILKGKLSTSEDFIALKIENDFKVVKLAEALMYIQIFHTLCQE